MKTVEELICQIGPKYKKGREGNLFFIWNDFLEAVHKLAETINTTELGAAYSISIIYYTKDDDDKVYRKNQAILNFDEKTPVIYEDHDVFLGRKTKLEVCFYDLLSKANKEEYVDVSDFDVVDFFGAENPIQKIELHFFLPREEL